MLSFIFSIIIAVLIVLTAYYIDQKILAMWRTRNAKGTTPSYRLGSTIMRIGLWLTVLLILEDMFFTVQTPVLVFAGITLFSVGMACRDLFANLVACTYIPFCAGACVQMGEEIFLISEITLLYTIISYPNSSNVKYVPNSIFLELPFTLIEVDDEVDDEVETAVDAELEVTKTPKKVAKKQPSTKSASASKKKPNN